MSEQLARKFHEIYERLAPSFGYETRTETRAFEPTTPNGRLMIAVTDEIEDELQQRIDELTAELAVLRQQVRPVYVVTMYRYGDKEKHSYVYGVFSTEATAREWGEKEKDYRGGKYEPEIIRFYVDSPTDFLKVTN